MTKTMIDRDLLERIGELMHIIAHRQDDYGVEAEYLGSLLKKVLANPNQQGEAEWLQGRASSTYPTPRMVCIRRSPKGSSTFIRKRRIATSTTLVSQSKLMSQTKAVISVRVSTSPVRRMSRCSNANSLLVRSIR